MGDREPAPNLGVHVYGLAAFALGAIELLWGDFAFIWHPVQPGVPYRTALAYVVGVMLVVAGAAAQWRKTARPALVVLGVLYALAACLWLPRVIGYPRIFGTWGGFNEQFVLAVAAVVGYASLRASMAPKDARLVARDFLAGRTLFGLCVVVLGLVHFSALPQTAEMVPTWIPPGQRFWAAATGLAMVLAGVAIASGVQSALAARLFTLLIGSFAAFVWVPRIAAEPSGHVAWAGTAITVAMLGAGWMVADALGPVARPRAARGLAYGVACALFAAIAGRPAALRGATPNEGGDVVSPIVELRQYTLHPGKRDSLIDLFDARFVEPQEALGITVIGQFRNLDDPNKFVWVRGFPDMESRERGLTGFYLHGDAWKAHRDAANATIIDNDNVLLLRPVHPESGFVLDRAARAAVGTRGAGPGMMVATIYHLDPTPEKEADFVRFFDASVAPLLAGAGAPVVAAFVPERSANTFPRLPVREGEHVFVWFSRFASTEAYDRFRAALSATPRWRDSVEVELSSKIREPQVLRLSPTARSRLHG